MKSFDTPLFIETIQCYPSLYNQAHPDYKDPGMKSQVWKEIAKQFNIVSGEAAKAKWRNVRDSYVKHLKSLKFGNPKRKYSTWPWSDKMDWLIPYVTGRQVLVDGVDGDPNLFLKQENWEEPPQPEAILADDTQEPVIRRNQLHPTPEYMDTVKVELLDPTDIMMLSHARRIRGFSRRRQAQLGMKIAHIVMEAELEEIAEEEAASSSLRS